MSNIKISDVIAQVDQEVIDAYRAASKGKLNTFNQCVSAEIKAHYENSSNFTVETILDALCESLDGSYMREFNIEPEGFDLVVNNGRLTFVRS